MSSQPIPSRRPRSIARWIGWGAAALLLAAPLVAMKFTNEVNWDETDFIVFGTMLLAVGGAIELIVHFVPRRRNRLLTIGAALFAFLWLWAELAVGVFTDWGS